MDKLIFYIFLAQLDACLILFIFYFGLQEEDQNVVPQLNAVRAVLLEIGLERRNKIRVRKDLVMGFFIGNSFIDDMKYTKYEENPIQRNYKGLLQLVAR